MRSASRIDANHVEIKNIFLSFGFDVIDTAAYSGKMLDLLVTLGDHFFCYVEIKDGNKPKSMRKLTPSEINFIKKRPDKCVVIESVEQAKTFCCSAIAGEKF